MDIQEISRADILDILFEGRNKEYGAYDLRRTYNRRLAKALAGMASVCLLLIGSYTWAVKSGPTHAPLPVIDDPIKLIGPLPDQPVPPPPPVIKPPRQMASIRSVVPRIVPDQQVKPEDVPPPNDAVEHVQISTVTRDGDLSDIVPPPSSGNGVAQGVIEPPRPKEDISIHEFVEIESAYPAGMEAWKRFLSKNFRVPDEAINNNVSGTVTVQFVVDKEGNVSDVHAVSGPEELRAEAVRVIKKSGKWTPAIQNGLKVNSYKRQPIVVRLQNE